jgi:hypothetical protein
VSSVFRLSCKTKFVLLLFGVSVVITGQLKDVMSSQMGAW